jgi:hypothetical protein
MLLAQLAFLQLDCLRCLALERELGHLIVFVGYYDGLLNFVLQELGHPNTHVILY